MEGEWMRVGDVGLKCPICLKPDWCLLHYQGKKVLCSRVKSNVKLSCGWIHKIYENGLTVKSKKLGRKRSNMCINWNSLAKLYFRKSYRRKEMVDLSEQLGIPVGSLRSIWRMGWDGEAYTIPCYDGFGEMNGIMRRFPDARKIWVSRSRNGLFIPKLKSWQGNLFVAEGWSDTAALVEMGFRAIGRASCQAGTPYIKTLLGHHTAIRQVTIVADNDKVGITGAHELAKALYGTVDIAVTEVPAKWGDFRSWFQAGASIGDVIDKSRRVL